MEKTEKKIDWGGVLIGVLFLIAGIASFAMPGVVLESLVIYFGIMAIIKGVMNFVSYSKLRKATGSASGWLIAGGILDILFGLLVLLNLFANFLTILFVGYAFAIWFITDSITRIFSAKPLKEQSKFAYWLTVILNVLCAVIGVGMFFRPVVSALTIGILIGMYFVIFAVTKIIDSFSSKA